jgi:hypothetical protein
VRCHPLVAFGQGAYRGDLIVQCAQYIPMTRSMRFDTGRRPQAQKSLFSYEVSVGEPIQVSHGTGNIREAAAKPHDIHDLVDPSNNLYPSGVTRLAGNEALARCFAAKSAL